MLTSTSTDELLHRLDALAPHVGHTPLFRIRNLVRNPRVAVYAKLEWQQLSGSVKARPAYWMLREGLRRGELRPGQTVLESSSGNTAIALAALCRAVGLNIKIFLPDKASPERKHLLRAYGAEIVYTPGVEGSDGAMDRVREYYAAHSKTHFYINQYANEDNASAHAELLAPEIHQQTGGQITHFVCGLGTTGTFVGTSRRLKAYDSAIECVALQPDIALHGLEGWKHLPTVQTPPIYDEAVPDRIVEVTAEGALDHLRLLARNEGLLVSPSAAANLMGALKVAEDLDEGVVVTTFADSADKYGEHLQRLFA